LQETITDLLLLRNPRATVAEAAPLVAAWRMLEDAPVRSRMRVDEPFLSFTALGEAIARVATRPLVVAIGRSESRSDPDIYLESAPLPFSGGRIAGTHTVRGPEDAPPAPFVTLEKSPPARLVTVVAEDSTGSMALWVERQPEGWMLLASSSFPATDRVLRALKGLEVEPHGGLRPRVPTPGSVAPVTPPTP
jgi:hypothetical protein